jgi:hypothetical protein
MAHSKAPFDTNINQNTPSPHNRHLASKTGSKHTLPQTLPKQVCLAVAVPQLQTRPATKDDTLVNMTAAAAASMTLYSANQQQYCLHSWSGAATARF